MCLNRIVMNIIKAKCVGNKNLYYLGITDNYESYLVAREDTDESKVLNKEEYDFIKIWYNKKSRAKSV